jgi:hypothetical protein
MYIWKSIFLDPKENKYSYGRVIERVNTKNMNSRASRF